MLWVLVSFLVFNAAVNAGPILQVSGPIDFSVAAANPDPFGNHTFLVASWKQAIGYNGVNISFLGNGVFSTASGTAYLTTNMGSGTTVADEIASTNFSTLVGPPSPISLFSDLTLPASSYYLMIFAGPGSQIAWAATNSPTTTLGTGVSLNFSAADGENLAALLHYASYPPATDPIFGFQDNLLVDVTSVPEPGTLSMLVVCGFASLIFGIHGIQIWEQLGSRTAAFSFKAAFLSRRNSRRTTA
jgi:hypothetical protein